MDHPNNEVTAAAPADLDRWLEVLREYGYRVLPAPAPNHWHLATTPQPPEKGDA